MTLYVSHIITHNLQSHKGTHVIELPESGLVRFQGENNDGKSVIVKASHAMVSVGITSPKVRKALINYDCNQAYLTYRRSDGMELTMYVTHDSGSCYYELKRPDGSVVRRSLLEKGQDELVEEFGLHYDKYRGFSLNIYMTYDPLLLINTGGPTSFDFISCAITDKNVTQAIDSLEEIQKELRVQRERAQDGLRIAATEMNRLEYCDEDAEIAKMQRFSTLKTELQVLSSIPQMDYIQFPPNINDLEILMIVDELLEDDTHLFRTVGDTLIQDLEKLFVLSKLIDVSPELSEHLSVLKALEDNVCPTCERSFADQATHIH